MEKSKSNKNKLLSSWLCQDVKSVSNLGTVKLGVTNADEL